MIEVLAADTFLYRGNRTVNRVETLLRKCEWRRFYIDEEWTLHIKTDVGSYAVENDKWVPLNGDFSWIGPENTEGD